MSTSATTCPFKPSGDDPVPTDTQAYFRARNQHRVHALLLDEFVRSGLTQAQLARRSRKRPEVVSRILGEPGNYRLNTLSDIFFAMCGGEPGFNIEYPLEARRRNQNEPAWLSAGKLDFGMPADYTQSKQTATLELAK